MNKISEHKKEIEKLQTAKGKLRDNVYKQEITINKMEKKLGKVSESSIKKTVNRALLHQPSGTLTS